MVPTLRPRNVQSGFHEDADYIVHVAWKEAMEQGMRFCYSENGVLLTPGFDGIVPPELLEGVADDTNEEDAAEAYAKAKEFQEHLSFITTNAKRQAEVRI